MKCFHHPDLNPVATCHECERGLCPACSERFEKILCQKCLFKEKHSNTQKNILSLILTVICFFAFTYFFGAYLNGHPKELGFSKGWFISLILVFSYWGWSFLSEYFPSLLVGNTNAWFIYLLSKFLAACFIGIIVGPYQIFRRIHFLIFSQMKHSRF